MMTSWALLHHNHSSFLLLAMTLTLHGATVMSYSSGAPDIACSTLTPSQSFHRAQPQPIESLPYTVTVKPLSANQFSCEYTLARNA